MIYYFAVSFSASDHHENKKKILLDVVAFKVILKQSRSIKNEECL